MQESEKVASDIILPEEVLILLGLFHTVVLPLPVNVQEVLLLVVAKSCVDPLYETELEAEVRVMVGGRIDTIEEAVAVPPGLVQESEKVVFEARGPEDLESDNLVGNENI